MYVFVGGNMFADVRENGGSFAGCERVLFVACDSSLLAVW